MVNWRSCARVIHAAAVLVFSLMLILNQSYSQAGTPDDSYTIERYYAQTVGDTQQSTTATTPQDALTLTFTPPTTKDYLVMATALTNNSSTSYSTIVQFVEGATTYSETYHKPVDASINWRSFGTHKVFSLTGGTPYTFKVQYRTENAAGTAFIKRVALAALEVTNYYNSEAETEQFTTSTTYVDMVTLTFTPPSQADYLMLWTANLRSDTAGKDADGQLTMDAVSDSGVVQSGTQYMSWGAIEKENLTAVSHTFIIQIQTQNPATAYIKSARITAVPLTALGSDQYAESEAESGTQSITYVDKTTLSFTPTTRGDYLSVSSGLGRQESASYAFYANLDVDGTSEGEYVFVTGSDRIYRSFMMVGKSNLTAASHTYKIQWHTNNAASNTEAFIKNANIIAINTNTAESYNNSAHTTVDNNFTTGETTAYIWAHGLDTSTNYNVAYYDAGTSGGQLQGSDNNIVPTSYGNLSSAWALNGNPEATAGTWHAVVFRAGSTPPQNYNDAAGTTGYVVADSFTVQAAAIPEFPTVLSGVAVTGMCFGIFYWMRKGRR